MKNSKIESFTLVELLIVLALISILATVLIVIIKPGIIFSKARDTKRIADIKNIEKTIDSLSTEQNFYELNYASPNIVYISLQDSSSTCGSYLSQLPSLPSGWSYHCSATPTNIDGTGWIPIPFSNFPIINISQLFIDPLNKPPYYYSFVVGGSYEVTAALETDSNKGPDAIGGKDGGDHNFVYETGTDKKLTPSSVQARAEPDSLKQGLVAWWTFDEGSGTTTKDLSGNNNNGNFYNFNWTATSGWVDGKVGKALSFDGTNDKVAISNSISLNPNSFTISHWVKTSLYGDPYITVGNTNNCSGYRFGVNSLGSGIRFLIGDCNPYTESGGGPFVADNKWHLISGVYDRGNVFKGYIDGKLVVSVPIGTYPNMSIGAPSIGNNCCGLVFAGLIDEVRIYNRALSNSEIQALYNAAK